MALASYTKRPGEWIQWFYQMHWWEMGMLRFVWFSINSLWTLAGLRSVWKPTCYLAWPEFVTLYCFTCHVQFSLDAAVVTFWASSDLILKTNKVKRTGPLDMFVHLLISKEIVWMLFCGHEVSLYTVCTQCGTVTAARFWVGLHFICLRSSQHSRVFVNILNLKPVSIFHW